MSHDVEVDLDDRPGALSVLAEALGEAGVALQGGGAFTHPHGATAHFLVADGHRAREVLERAQYSDHDHRLVLVVRAGDEEVAEGISRAWSEGRR